MFFFRTGGESVTAVVVKGSQCKRGRVSQRGRQFSFVGNCDLAVGRTLERVRN